MTPNGSTEDEVTAPGARRLLREAETALENEETQRAKARLAQAHQTLVESRADELELSGPLQEALEDAVAAEGFTEDLPIERDTIPDEWELDGLELAETPVHLERELQSVGDEGPFRVTIEPEPGAESQYRLRIEQLPY